MKISYNYSTWVSSREERKPVKFNNGWREGNEKKLKLSCTLKREMEMTEGLAIVEEADKRRSVCNVKADQSDLHDKRAM